MGSGSMYWVRRSSIVSIWDQHLASTPFVWGIRIMYLGLLKLFLLRFRGLGFEIWNVRCGIWMETEIRGLGSGSMYWVRRSSIVKIWDQQLTSMPHKEIRNVESGSGVWGLGFGM
uniref:Uncharacterized protein n=1 Tax=Eutreptiella gymnastica TaxID=73025 RepID=A0A7S1I3W2_9EUGL